MPHRLALRYAQALAVFHHAALHVVHVIDPVAYAFPEVVRYFMKTGQRGT